MRTGHSRFGHRMWRGLGRAQAMLAILASSALAAIGGGGCERKQAGAAPPGGPVEVVVHTVRARTMPIVYEFVGQTQASKTVEVRSRVQGFLEKRAFEEGKHVDEGDTLFKIDDRSFKADLEVARAQLARAQAELANASRQVGRLQELQRQGATSPRELDDWETQERTARANVRLYEANVAQAQLNLSYTMIVSPLRGKVGLTMKDEGSLVDAGPNSLLTTVWQVDPIYVLFSISEREWLQWREDVAAERVRLGQGLAKPKVQIVLLDGTVYEAKGELDFFDATVNPQTGTATARGVFSNPLPEPTAERPEPEEPLKPGQFVRARIVGWERPNSLTVPKRAVLQTPSGPVVMGVNSESKVEVRAIRTGAWSGDEWVVLEGLKAGDRVISDGFMKAPPGTMVKAIDRAEQGAGAGAGGQSFEGVK